MILHRWRSQSQSQSVRQHHLAPLLALPLIFTINTTAALQSVLHCSNTTEQHLQAGRPLSSDPFLLDATKSQS